MNNSGPGAQGLKIGLVSMVLDKSNRHAKNFLDIVNAHEDLDIIVFPGWTLFDKTQLALVKKGVKNKNSLVIFEVWKDHLFEGNQRHQGYFIKNGILNDRDIIQKFADSKEIIKKGKDFMKSYLDEIKDKRIIEYKGRKICWLICGEVNVLRNIQKNSNKVEFRFPEDKELKKAFRKIYNETDVFVNPTHTIMGNQGKLARRREFLSRNKVFCSVSNADISKGQKLKSKSSQYLYKNGRAIDGKLLEENSRFILKEYDV
jgi:hypothetical protein